MEIESPEVEVDGVAEALAVAIAAGASLDGLNAGVDVPLRFPPVES